MTDKDTYLTLAKRGDALYEEKHSKFYGTAFPVTGEEDAVALIRAVSGEMPDATHHVFAYLTDRGAHARCSDDGEPQGTAGAPILDLIKKSGLNNLAVVVTRYFGGIKLGAGGLVRAYAEAAKRAMDASGAAVFRPFTDFTIRCEYPAHDLLRSRFPSAGITVLDTAYSDAVTLRCTVAAESFPAACALLSELSAGRIVPCDTEERLGREPV